MKKSPMEVFQAFGQGLMSGTDSWKDVVANNVTFKGPIDQVNTLEAFASLNEKFMPMMKNNQVKQVLEAGNFVITQVIWDLAMPSGNTVQLDMTEWYEIKDEKIQNIKVYYDAEELRKEMNK